MVSKLRRLYQEIKKRAQERETPETKTRNAQKEPNRDLRKEKEKEKEKKDLLKRKTGVLRDTDLFFTNGKCGLGEEEKKRGFI